jgi:23S rRNA pseudouridine1911/1915/1917 synthase
MPGSSALKIRVREGDCGKRLDFLVSSLIPECSRSMAARLIRQGGIRVQGATCKPGYRVKTADELLVEIPSPEPADIPAEPLAIRIIYEDKDIVVIDKPAGMVVHPAPGHYTGTLVNALLYHCPDL